MEYYSHHHHWENTETSDGDDAVFYEELTKQILMIMDDDQNTETNVRAGKSANKFQRRSVIYGGGLAGSGNYFSWGDDESGRRLEVPNWMERLWMAGGNNATAGGTGVFIPRGVEAAAGKSRRRRRQNNKSRRNKVTGGGGRIQYSSAGHMNMIHG